MRAIELVSDEELLKRDALRREGIERLRARVNQARRLKVEIAQLANKFIRTQVRTDADAEAISLAMFRLNQAIYMAHLLKQALIGL